MPAKTTKPPRLAPGDVVAVVAPSASHAGRYPRRTTRAIKAVESCGFTVQVMPHALQQSAPDTGMSWVSGTIAQRVADLHAAFADPSVRAVISTIGGDHSAQLLDSLDYELVAENPKILCGYSDITSLLHAVHGETGLVTFYGPALLAQFGEWPQPYLETVDHFLTVTTQPDPVGEIPVFDTVVGEFIDWADDEVRPRRRVAASGRRVITDGTATGPLAVGCLPTLRQLVGTRWQPDLRGRILVLDIPDLGYQLGHLDADLWHLRNAGILPDLAGLVVGRPRLLDPADIDLLCRVVRAATGPYRYPVVAQFECGHSDPVATLPIGLPARLSGATLTVLESAVW